MRTRIPLVLLVLAIAGLAGAVSSRAHAAVPRADHVIVVVMENHSYDQVRTAPYTASLIGSSACLSASYALVHPSQPNYIALWSGGTQGVSNDQCPPPGAPYTAENLGHACQAAGLEWKAYCEDLPWAGDPSCIASGGLYVRKHAPWTDFSNLDHTRERPYADLAADIAGGTLPALAFVIPNQCNNTHDCPVAAGDAWLAANLPAIIQAAGPRGLVVLTWDEDDSHSGNHILTVFAGGLVNPGSVSAQHVTHYTVLGALCDALGLSRIGASASEPAVDSIWFVSSAPEPGRTSGMRLGRAVPNPSTAGFELLLSGVPDAATPAKTGIRAQVRDAAGRRIAVPEVIPSPGGACISWNGRLADGRKAPAGAYWLEVRTIEAHARRELIVLR